MSLRLKLLSIGSADLMKILFSHRFFWPDTAPYATMLRSMARRMAERGHDVTVFSTQPSYHSSQSESQPAEQMLDGFRVIRMPIFKEDKKNPPVRLYNMLHYSWGLRRYIVKAHDYDVVTVSTFPPLLAARAALGAAKKISAKLVYHCQDIHPEVSYYSGMLKAGAAHWLMSQFDSKTCLGADKIVVLSDDMADTLRRRPGCEDLKPEIINNFILENFDAGPVATDVVIPSDKFTILFAGNIGRYQNLDVVIDAAGRLTHVPDIQFWFVGEGVAKAALQEQAGDLVGRSVFFVPHQHYSVAQHLMTCANLNLVSLIPDMYRVAYPSKTISAMANGCPVLAVLEPESELARMVREDDLGYVAPNNDAEALASTVMAAYEQRHCDGQLRDNVKRSYEQRFSVDRVLNRWAEMFEGLVV